MDIAAAAVVSRLCWRRGLIVSRAAIPQRVVDLGNPAGVQTNSTRTAASQVQMATRTQDRPAPSIVDGSNYRCRRGNAHLLLREQQQAEQRICCSSRSE